MPSSLPSVKDFDEAVAVLGGTTKAAEAIGRQAPAICQWRDRHKGRFPAEYFILVQRALNRKGYEAPAKLFTFLRARAG